MGKHILVVMSNATSEEREEEFNDWYTNQHLHDVVKVPGYKAAIRYEASAAQLAEGKPPWKYLAIYEVETDDVAKAAAGLSSAAADSDKMPLSDTLDQAGVYAYFFTPITDRIASRT
jgi:hypothetical protein